MKLKVDYIDKNKKRHIKKDIKMRLKVVYIDDTNYNGDDFTLGKTYIVFRQSRDVTGNEYYHVREDNYGMQTACFKFRFKICLESKLKRILK